MKDTIKIIMVALIMIGVGLGVSKSYDFNAMYEDIASARSEMGPISHNAACLNAIYEYNRDTDHEKLNAVGLPARWFTSFTPNYETSLSIDGSLLTRYYEDNNKHNSYVCIVDLTQKTLPVVQKWYHYN